MMHGKPGRIAILLLGLSGCATSDAPAPRDEPSAAHEAAITFTGVWFDEGEEFCMDFFPNRRCTASFPSPQCSPAVVGQPCTLGAECYQTLSPSRFRRFSCN